MVYKNETTFSSGLNMFLFYSHNAANVEKQKTAFSDCEIHLIFSNQFAIQNTSVYEYFLWYPSEKKFFKQWGTIFFIYNVKDEEA